MTEVCTVVIGAAETLSAMIERTAAFEGEVLAFSDHEALRALEEIVRRRPQVVTIDRQFAVTARGAALISRIKGDRDLAGLELHIVSHAVDQTRVLLASEPPGETDTAVVEMGPPVAARQAPRYVISGDMHILLDSSAVRLIDLSETGAQVLSSTALKPNQRVRVTLTDDRGAVRFNGVIAWAAFEIPPEHSPQYRAGVSFIDANGGTVGAFCMRHKQT